MATDKEIVEVMESIQLPETALDIKQLNLIRGVEVQGNTVRVTMASTGLSPQRQEWLTDQIKEKVEPLTRAEKLEIEFKDLKSHELNQVGNIIAVISGKGGVGKSVVSSLLAVALNRQGYSVGILDADLTGPSIPRMFGLTERPEGTESAILPVLSNNGIAVMSLNLVLPQEDEAVIWRGPVINQVIRQFWEGVLWGKRDFLIVDLPPGTGDAPLTVMQQLQLSGIVIVFTPQALTSMIVRKTVRMAQKLEKPILGVVENMSYLYIPELKKKMEIFGPSHAVHMSEAARAPILAQLPLDPELVKLCDEGKIEEYRSELVEKLGNGLTRSLKTVKGMEAP